VSDFEKAILGILGVCVAAGAAWLVVDLAKKHPESAKTIINGVSEFADIAADNISSHPDDKLPIEAIKKGKDFLVEITNHEIDEYHNQNRRWFW